MRLLPDIFQVPGSSKKSFGRPSQRTDHGNTAWPRVLTGLGHHASRPSHLTSQGPSVFGNRTHRLAGHPLPRPGLVAHHGAGSCVWPAECVPGALEPPTASAGGRGGECPSGASSGDRKPTSTNSVTRYHKPPAGGPEAPGLPDKELVGLVAPGGTQQGWEALQCTSHGPRGSSPCGLCRPAPGNRPQFIQYLDLLKY